MRGGAVLLALLIGGPIYAGPSDSGRLPPCDAPDVDPWVTELRDGVLSFDLLAKYAVELYGSPITCEGSVTTEFDGTKFGLLRLGFTGGARFQVETLPPEMSVATLRNPAGFADEDAARRVLEAHCDTVGVEIDWSAPRTTTDGDERIETYSDPDEGMNASASLVFREDTLVALRFSLAL
ncbi:MAG: hypothetical protein ACRELC_12080 [Gemmatimonadota bacterium]